MKKKVAFLSVPEQASIYIDGTPIEDYELADKFREECLNSDGKVICDKDTLHDNWLITKKLSKIWWLLTDEERDNVAGFIIRGWLFFYIRYVREGKKDCKGGTGSWKYAVCGHNAMIRYLRFGEGEKHYDEISHCYWSRDKKTEYCYWTESYDLPVYICSIVTSGPGYGHAVCAFQIKKDPKDFNSWRFFQWTSDNIKPGDSQMPCHWGGKTIHIYIDKPKRMSCGGCTIENIAKWYIDKETCEPVPE